MCNACIAMLNEARPVDDFSERMLDMLNQGALSLMVSIGHRTGLFDSMAELTAASTEEIAAHTGLECRYVKEWLAAVVAGGIVQYRVEDAHYQLPESHAAMLCRKSSPDNIAVYAQYIGMMGLVEDKIVDCFRKGGGVGYEHFPRFQEVMAEDSGQTVLSALDEHILPLLGPGVARLEQGIKVLDIGCGKGSVLLHLARSYPNSKFVGYDLSEQALTFARAAAKSLGLQNIQFIERDLSDFDQLAETRVFDLITAFDAIHDQANPQGVLDGIYRSLKQSGQFLMQDIRASSQLENNLDHPIAPLLYTLSTMHCMTVSLAQGGAGLGTMWGEELAVEMLRQAGFEDISIHQLEHDFQNNFYLMQK
ncbi:MAG: class I SAM-dependent methyltransferase [Gammaproteobacteria bacterium]|nr:class I SAM-dependent methyltransferase [Gammaproteobacteria bacterium]